MSEAKNDWIGTEAGRKHFFGTIKEMGISNDEAHHALGVTSMKEVSKGLDETLAFLEEWNQATRQETPEPTEAPPEQVPETAEIPSGIVPAERPDLSAPEWQGRQDIDILGSRIKSMLPGGDKLSIGQARALAQYSLATGANPFRGEVYAYKDNTGFHIVEGYKLLVRWAMRQSLYSETYTLLEDLPEGDIGFRCRILRDDRTQQLKEFTDMGATWKEAYNTVSVFADGVVTVDDRTTRTGKLMDPPKGWTWEQVARKRALKNALNLSHGAPSLKEIAEETWLPELSVHSQSAEMTQRWKEMSDDMDERYPHLMKGTRRPVRGPGGAEWAPKLKGDIESAPSQQWDLELANLSDEEREALFERNKEILHGTEAERRGEHI